MKVDVAVIGGGVSGLSAALFTGHAGLKTIVFDTGKSQVKGITSFRNILGAPGISGNQLIEQYQEQVKDYVDLFQVKVDALERNGEGFVIHANSKSFEATHVVIATNIEYDLLESLGLEIEINENIKSGKIKKVVGVNWEGITPIPHLYISGLLSGIPSQVMIAAGQGAAVGVRITQDATGDKYMWHDK